MSNHLAVATVTAAIGFRTWKAARAAVPDVISRYGRPVAPGGAGNGPEQGKPVINVYLYQATANAAQRNADLPTRTSDGRTVSRPRAAVDLHYLISFYGMDDDLVPDRMLGAVVRDLHARPVLTKDDIQSGIVHAPLRNPSPLLNSDLAQALESVKLNPANLSLDEVSKLWSTLVQTPHALSLTYTANAVLLDSEEAPIQPQPVLKPVIRPPGVQRGSDGSPSGEGVGLLPLPQVEGIWIGLPQAMEIRKKLKGMPAAEKGARIVFFGVNLFGESVTVRLTRRSGEVVEAFVVLPEQRSQDEVWFDLDLKNDPPSARYMLELELARNGARFLTTPVPLDIAPRMLAIVPKSIAASGNKTVTLRVTCSSNVQLEQKVVLLIAGLEITANARTKETNSLSFAFDPRGLSGKFEAKLRVDEIDSLPAVTFDAKQGRLVFDEKRRHFVEFRP